LPVIETNRFHARIARKRPRKADGGVLTSREKHEGMLMVHGLLRIRLITQLKRGYAIFYLFIKVIVNRR
jgi:hypothetical protein